MAIWGDISQTVTAVAAVTALAGGYVQFFVKRSLLPCIEFDVDFKTLHDSSNQSVGEIAYIIKNVGPGEGTVANVRGRAMYRLAGQSDIYKDGVEPDFPHRLLPAAPPEEAPKTENAAKVMTSTVGRSERGWFQLASGQSNFIQPGVTQFYRKPVVLPLEAGLIHVWGRFDYKMHSTMMSRSIARKVLPAPTDQALQKGFVEYTVRRTFMIGGGYVD